MCFLGFVNCFFKLVKCVFVLIFFSVCVVLLISVNVFFVYENLWVGVEFFFLWNYGEDLEILSFSGYRRFRKDVLKIVYVFL